MLLIFLPWKLSLLKDIMPLLKEGYLKEGIGPTPHILSISALSFARFWASIIPSPTEKIISRGGKAKKKGAVTK